MRVRSHAERREVLVIDTCEWMPRSEEHPIRDPVARLRPVVWTDERLQTVTMEVGEEILEYKCTRNMY